MVKLSKSPQNIQIFTFPSEVKGIGAKFGASTVSTMSYE